MKIGIPTEIKNNENRIGITPSGVVSLVSNKHQVYIQKDAGIGSGISNEELIEAGAKIVNTAKEVWDCEMVIKVKEPLKEEYGYFREDLILFTYLHLAAEKELTEALLKSKCTAIAYETVTLNNSLPLLRPMSEVAGSRATIIGATFLEKHRGGRGMLLSGIPGVERGVVSIVGGGIAGVAAAKMAIGLGAKVNILELNEERLRWLDDTFKNTINTYKSNKHNISTLSQEADLLISTVLIPGEKAPKLVTEEMVKKMKKGSVIVDISIDQGGSVETIDRITTHDNPVFEKHGVLHYSVANMPGAVPRTSTYGLTNATMPYAVKIANLGWKQACINDKGLAMGLNVIAGQITNEPVAKSLNMEFTPYSKYL